MVDDYILDKVLDKTKERIGIEKFVDTKILIDTDNKFPVDVTFKNVAMFIIEDGDKSYTYIFLAGASVVLETGKILVKVDVR